MGPRRGRCDPPAGLGPLLISALAALPAAATPSSGSPTVSPSPSVLFSSDSGCPAKRQTVKYLYQGAWRQSYALLQGPYQVVLTAYAQGSSSSAFKVMPRLWEPFDPPQQAAYATETVTAPAAPASAELTVQWQQPSLVNTVIEVQTDAGQCVTVTAARVEWIASPPPPSPPPSPPRPPYPPAPPPPPPQTPVPPVVITRSPSNQAWLLPVAIGCGVVGVGIIVGIIVLFKYKVCNNNQARGADVAQRVREIQYQEEEMQEREARLQRTRSRSRRGSRRGSAGGAGPLSPTSPTEDQRQAWSRWLQRVQQERLRAILAASERADAEAAARAAEHAQGEMEAEGQLDQQVKIDVLMSQLPSAPPGTRLQCCVCLDEGGEMATEPVDGACWAGLPCEHTLHTHCARQWFEASLAKGHAPTCPVCRAEMWRHEPGLSPRDS